MRGGAHPRDADGRPTHQGGGDSASRGTLPTLTEVVDLGNLPTPHETLEDDADPDTRDDATAPTERALPTDEQLTQRVLAELSRQIDVVLEYRLREVLGPLLARAADNVVRDARSELASTLRDVVARAVAAELARQRQR